MIEDEHQPYDKSSKWLIQHHGDSLLRLAKIENIQAWRPAPAEIVQPRQWPDGLLEVRLQGESKDDLFLLEVATYPERRVGEQLTRDLMLVYLDRGELPEAVTLVLRPKGKYCVPESRNLRSRHAWIPGTPYAILGQETVSGTVSSVVSGASFCSAPAIRLPRSVVFRRLGFPA